MTFEAQEHQIGDNNIGADHSNTYADIAADIWSGRNLANETNSSEQLDTSYSPGNRPDDERSSYPGDRKIPPTRGAEKD
jgi:hypothetical protein